MRRDELDRLAADLDAIRARLDRTREQDTSLARTEIAAVLRDLRRLHNDADLPLRRDTDAES